MLLICFPSFVKPCLINYFHHSHLFSYFVLFKYISCISTPYICCIYVIMHPGFCNSTQAALWLELHRTVYILKESNFLLFFPCEKVKLWKTSPPDSFETVWNSRVKTVSQKAAKHDNCSDKVFAVVSIFPERLSRCFHSLTKHYAAVWIQEFASFSCAKEPLALEFIK